MCEFDVFLDKVIVFKGAVYARVDADSVTLKDVLGISKKIENCSVVEIDVGLERLILSSNTK